MRTFRKTQGFTLLELLFSLAIMVILVSLGLPAFTETLKANRAEQTIHNLHRIIQQSRNLAVTHNEIITLCKSSDLVSCGGDWGDGILIFADANQSGSADNDETIYHTVNRIYEDGSLSWRSFGNKSYLQFLPTGTTNYQNGTFTYCDKDKDVTLARGISVAVTGRIQRAFDRNGDGIRENSSGKPLKCS